VNGRFDLVGLDADDTLWHSEDSFAVVEARFVELVGPYSPAGVDVGGALSATERAHLPISGYGVKSFTLAMVKAAVNVTEGSVPAAVLGQLVDAGLAMLTEDVRLLPDVPAVLADVGRDHRLVLITKGDLVHQTRKVRTSGLDHHFEHIRVVLEKDVANYRDLLDEWGIDPSRFLMVGNSVRSDILPILELGGHGVHVPYHVTWAHEVVLEHDSEFAELSSIRELVAWLDG